MRNSSLMPSLAVLRCFEAAAKYQSFTAAAEELELTQGAVSRHVKELEERIGTALFRREGRGVRLTDAGTNLAVNLTSDLERLHRTISNAAASGDDKEILSIAVLPTFGARWLIPRIREFQSGREKFELMVHSRSEPFNLIESGIDLAIHFGNEDWPGARLTPLRREELLAVAAPQLVDEFQLEKPADLFRVQLLHLTSRPTLWDAFRRTVSGIEAPALKGSYFDQFSLIISAAVAGFGAAILPAYLIENELQTKKLIPIAEVPETKRRYYIATPEGSTKPLAKTFSAWLRKHCQTAPNQFPA